MEPFYRSLLIFLAFFISLIYILMGIRKAPHSRGPSTFFGLMLLFFFSSLSQLGAQGQKVSNIDQVDIISMEMEDHLFSSDQWQTFKVFWRELDDITLSERCVSRNSTLNFGIINSEEYYSYTHLLEECEGALGELEEQQLLKDFEVQLLISICKERLSYHYVYPVTLLLAHVGPPPYTPEKMDSIDALENQLDMISELRRSENISWSDYLEAMEIVQNEIPRIYLLSRLETFRYPLVSSLEDNWSLVNLQSKMEEELLEYQQNSGELSSDSYKILTEKCLIIREFMSDWDAQKERIDFMILNLEADINNRQE